MAAATENSHLPTLAVPKLRTGDPDMTVASVILAGLQTERLNGTGEVPDPINSLPIMDQIRLMIELQREAARDAAFPSKATLAMTREMNSRLMSMYRRKPFASVRPGQYDIDSRVTMSPATHPITNIVKAENRRDVDARLNTLTSAALGRGSLQMGRQLGTYLSQRMQDQFKEWEGAHEAETSALEALHPKIQEVGRLLKANNIAEAEACLNLLVQEGTIAGVEYERFRADERLCEFMWAARYRKVTGGQKLFPLVAKYRSDHFNFSLPHIEVNVQRVKEIYKTIVDSLPEELSTEEYSRFTALVGGKLIVNGSVEQLGFGSRSPITKLALHIAKRELAFQTFLGLSDQPEFAYQAYRSAQEVIKEDAKGREIYEKALQLAQEARQPRSMRLLPVAPKLVAAAYVAADVIKESGFVERTPVDLIRREEEYVQRGQQAILEIFADPQARELLMQDHSSANAGNKARLLQYIREVAGKHQLEAWLKRTTSLRRRSNPYAGVSEEVLPPKRGEVRATMPLKPSAYLSSQKIYNLVQGYEKLGIEEAKILKLLGVIRQGDEYSVDSQKKNPIIERIAGHVATIDYGRKRFAELVEAGVFQDNKINPSVTGQTDFYGLTSGIIQAEQELVSLDKHIEQLLKFGYVGGAALRTFTRVAKTLSAGTIGSFGQGSFTAISAPANLGPEKPLELRFGSGDDIRRFFGTR